MHKLYDLKKQLCEGLETFADRGVTEQNIGTIDKLAHALKCVETVLEKEEGGSSFRSYDRGSYDGSYDGGSYRRSYDGAYRFYDDGGRSMARKRDSMGRYSRGEELDGLADTMRSVMDRIPEEIRGDANRLLRKIEEQG